MYMYKEKPVYAELSYKICGVLFAVHNELGRYRNEKQYADAVEKYLSLFNIPYEREVVIPVSFAGEAPGRNKIDFGEGKPKPFLDNEFPDVVDKLSRLDESGKTGFDRFNTKFMIFRQKIIEKYITNFKDVP